MVKSGWIGKIARRWTAESHLVEATSISLGLREYATVPLISFNFLQGALSPIKPHETLIANERLDCSLKSCQSKYCNKRRWK